MRCRRRTAFTALALLWPAAASLGAGDTSAPAPSVTVQTEYLATVDLVLDAPQAMGPVRVFNVPSGTIHGPKLNGTIIAPAADWLTVMPDGSFHLDIRATVRTDDGELILVEANGVAVPTKQVMDRLNKGETVTSNDEYIFATPRFVTSSAKYDWLNKTQALYKMVSLGQGHLKYDLFALR